MRSCARGATIAATAAAAPRTTVAADSCTATTDAAAPGSAAPGATAADRAQQPIRSAINFVRVDVIISDKQGTPVLDMKPDEFSIVEDGKPQKIESFSVVKIDPTTQIDAEMPREIRSDTDEEREAQRPDVRLFVILLDDYHVRRGNDMAVQEAAHGIHHEPARACGHGGADVSADAGHRPALLAKS